MPIEKIKISKINLESNAIEELANPREGSNFSNYIKLLIEEVIEGSGGRKFKIRSNETEVISIIRSSILSNSFENLINGSANRLLLKEIDAQKEVERLNVDIQPGILVQAVIIEHNVRKFVICKAEDSEFIDRDDFEIARGFPTKRKIFKSFLGVFDENDDISHILVTDSHNKIARYWWDGYLELDRYWDDAYNTSTAFEAIDLKILKPLKRESLSEYYNLRNSTIRYFRSDNSFVLESYLENAIGNYRPVSSAINVTDLKDKIRALPQKHSFDKSFDLVPQEIRAKIKTTVALTESIDLVIKEDIDIDSTIRAERGPDNQKYLMIRTDKGYDAFVKNQ